MNSAVGSGHPTSPELPTPPSGLRGTGRGAGEAVGTTGFSPVSLLTRAELLDHARHPRNRGPLPDADVVQAEANPLCGDVVTLYARVDPISYKLKAISFSGSGCIISQAAASMLTEYAVGKSAADVAAMGRENMEALLGGALSPSRVKCAMLPLIALRNGLQRHARGS